MTIKVYISGICGSHEVRKHQQRVLFILQTMPIDLQIIDVTEPGRDEDLIFMQEEVKKHNKKTQLPPQIFNDNEYCGDYADFQLANDDDQIMKFLKLEEAAPENLESPNNIEPSGDKITQNGISSHENDEEMNKDDTEMLDESPSNKQNDSLPEEQNIDEDTKENVKGDNVESEKKDEMADNTDKLSSEEVVNEEAAASEEEESE